MKWKKVSEYKTGNQKRIFIIAEAWVNHNWNVLLAYKLADEAKTAWADAVKFQTFFAEDVVTENWNMALYQKKNIWNEQSQLSMLKKLELKRNDFKKLKEYCNKIWIMFLSTPHWSLKDIDFLDSLWMKIFKFWSGDLTNIPALKFAAKKGKPIMLWTWMAYLNEVYDAINTIKEEWNDQITVLHCTTNYPCPFQEVNLEAMKTMIDQLNIDVGYSDHTLWYEVSLLASSLWAKVIEKHFTLDTNMPWPDHKASASPKELKWLISKIRKYENWKITKDDIIKKLWKTYHIIMGSAEKKPNSSELKIMKDVKKSIVISKNLSKWHIIINEDLALKRPMWWLEPKYYYDLIWKKTNKNLLKNKKITFNDIE